MHGLCYTIVGGRRAAFNSRMHCGTFASEYSKIRVFSLGVFNKHRFMITWLEWKQLDCHPAASSVRHDTRATRPQTFRKSLHETHWPCHRNCGISTLLPHMCIFATGHHRSTVRRVHRGSREYMFKHPHERIQSFKILRRRNI